MYKIIMHINYCEPEGNLRNAVATARDLGYDGIEFRGPNRERELTNSQYFDAIASALEVFPSACVLFGGPGPKLTSNTPDGLAREVENAVHFYDEANRRFGTTLFNVLFGKTCNPHFVEESLTTQSDHVSAYVDAIRAILTGLHSKDIVLSVETHAGYVHDSAAHTRTIIDLVGAADDCALYTTLDYPNMQYLPEPETFREVMTLIGDTIRYVHLKNILRVGDHTPIPVGLGDGSLNTRWILQTLYSSDFRGPVCLEAPRPGDRRYFAEKDIEYVREVLKDIS